MKKTETMLKKIKRALTKTKRSMKEMEQRLKGSYEKGFKDGSGKSDANPFKIKEEDVFIDPDDPNRPIEEQMRLRRNWYQRRNYHKRKKEEKEKALAVEIVTKAMGKTTKEKVEFVGQGQDQETQTNSKPKPENH